MVHILALYLSMVLAAVSPRLDQNRREAIANDVATVTLTSERAFDDDANGQKTALLLISIPYFETGKSWAAWIDDGRCNNPVWRAAHESWIRGGDCDGGRAWSMWQVHVSGDSVTRGRALIANRRAAIYAALVKARMSLRMGIGLCGYSGERPSSPKHCPRARKRLEKAVEWANAFPFEEPVPPELASK